MKLPSAWTEAPSIQIVTCSSLIALTFQPISRPFGASLLLFKIIKIFRASTAQLTVFQLLLVRELFLFSFMFSFMFSFTPTGLVTLVPSLGQSFEHPQHNSRCFNFYSYVNCFCFRSCFRSCFLSPLHSHIEPLALAYPPHSPTPPSLPYSHFFDPHPPHFPPPPSTHQTNSQPTP